MIEFFNHVFIYNIRKLFQINNKAGYGINLSYYFYFQFIIVTMIMWQAAFTKRSHVLLIAPIAFI